MHTRTFWDWVGDCTVQTIFFFMCSTSLNDLVVTEENTFYFTNTYEFNFTLEVHLRLRLGSVGFYDGCRGRIVLRGRLVPNGINMSPDGKYVSAVLHGWLLCCQLCPPVGVLTFRHNDISRAYNKIVDRNHCVNFSSFSFIRYL